MCLLSRELPFRCTVESLDIAQQRANLNDVRCFSDTFQKKELRPELKESFDEDRFAALMELAGPQVALELAERLDDDLTSVAQALDKAGKNGDHRTLRSQSHVLLAIAGTVGATRLHELSHSLNLIIRACETTNVRALLIEIRVCLEDVITRVRLVRSGLVSQT